MLKLRRGGYILVARRSDHPPRHVHVYRNGRFVVKWDLEHRQPMKGRASARIISIIEALEVEGEL